MNYQIEDCSATSALVVAIDVDGIVHSEWLIKFMFQPVGRYNVESIEYSEFDIVGELLSSSFVGEHHLPNGMLDNAKQSCLNYIMQNRLGDSAEFH